MILGKVEKYIIDNQLFSPKEQVIVGVSGGADSVALLDILCRLGYRCIVAHCNFHLRGKESDRDALFVKNLCTAYNVPFNQIDFDTLSYASERSVSIEMAARDLRYSWFDELRGKYNIDTVAVAHHRDDSVETILLNLFRGTGIRGLTGISARNGHIVRPLLCLTHQEISDYLKQHNLLYVEDSSNSEDIYIRNKIRLNILPLLETINPSVKDAISRTAEHLNQVEKIYKAYIEQARSEICEGNKININLLLKYQEPEAILFEILSGYKFNSATVKQIFEALYNQSGKIFYSETYELLKDRDYLIIREKTKLEADIFEIGKENAFISSLVSLMFETITVDTDFTIEKNKNIAYFDKSKINYPLVIRRWQKGDWFVPFGMKGKKKISDYFSDHKVNLFDKENTWLLCSGDDIIWVIGQRTDDRYKITPSTVEAIRISLLTI